MNATAPSALRTKRSTAVLVAGLGGAQLVAWAVLYYAIAVLGEPMRRELHVSYSYLFAAFALGMVVSGLLAPWAGRKVDQHGGRIVLAASGLVGAVGFVALAHAQSLPGLLVGWSINGLAMALGLYDTCFAAIGQEEPLRYRRAVTGVTLIAGFASTVSWPASHYLVQAWGWRGTCWIFAAALGLCVPLYLTVLPASRGAVKLRETHRSSTAPVTASVLKQARMLSLAFAGASLIGASMSTHLVATLNALQLPAEQAIWVASSIGVLQVLGRVLELAFGSRLKPVSLAILTFGALFISMLLLLAVETLPVLVFAFALLYGISNGLFTIVKATLPVEIFGLRNVGAVLGRFNAPSLVTRALAPLGFALVVSEMGTRVALLGVTGVGLAALVSYVVTTRGAARFSAPSTTIPFATSPPPETAAQGGQKGNPAVACSREG